MTSTTSFTTSDLETADVGCRLTRRYDHNLSQEASAPMPIPNLWEKLGKIYPSALIEPETVIPGLGLSLPKPRQQAQSGEDLSKPLYFTSEQTPPSHDSPSTAVSTPETEAPPPSTTPEPYQTSFKPPTSIYGQPPRRPRSSAQPLQQYSAPPTHQVQDYSSKFAVRHDHALADPPNRLTNLSPNPISHHSNIPKGPQSCQRTVLQQPWDSQPAESPYCRFRPVQAMRNRVVRRPTPSLDLEGASPAAPSNPTPAPRAPTRGDCWRANLEAHQSREREKNMRFLQAHGHDVAQLEQPCQALQPLNSNAQAQMLREQQHEMDRQNGRGKKGTRWYRPQQAQTAKEPPGSR